MYIQRLAKEYKLIMTGGSDFHREESDRFALKNVYCYFRIDSKYLREVNKVIG